MSLAFENGYALVITLKSVECNGDSASLPTVIGGLFEYFESLL